MHKLEYLKFLINKKSFKSVLKNSVNIIAY